MEKNKYAFNSQVLRIGDGGISLYIPAEVASKVGLNGHKGKHIRGCITENLNLAFYTGSSVEDLESEEDLEI